MFEILKLQLILTNIKIYMEYIHTSKSSQVKSRQVKKKRTRLNRIIIKYKKKNVFFVVVCHLIVQCYQSPLTEKAHNPTPILQY